MVEKNKIYDFLKHEYTQSQNKLQYLEDHANKYLNYILATLAALAGFLSLCIENGKISDYSIFSLLIIFGALIIGAFLIIILHYTVQCFRLGGYIKHLEKEINTTVGKKICAWESNFTSKHIHKDLTTNLIFMLVGLFFLFLLCVAIHISFVYIWKTWPLITLIVCAFVLLEIVTVVIYLCKVKKIHQITYDFFQSIKGQKINRSRSRKRKEQKR